MTAVSSTDALIARARELAERGNGLQAIADLTEANRVHPDGAVERELVRIRNVAWPEVDRSGPVRWGDDVADRFPGATEIPEVHVSELDAEIVRSAIRHHGGLVVRELFPAQWCDRLREGIDRSWEAYEHFRATKERDPAWYDPLDFSDHGLTPMGRAIIMSGGTAYVPDSPRLLFDLLEAFEQTGVKQMVTDYFGEAPALSLVKLAQRRLDPAATGGWHQDAAVYGMEARTLNVWVPVTRCGDVAPGLSMWPYPLDGLVETEGTEGTAEYTATTEAVAQLIADRPASSPVFEPGDAALFDQFLLHETNANPAVFTERRYGFESWFFAPSTYPEPKRWIPLAF